MLASIVRNGLYGSKNKGRSGTQDRSDHTGRKFGIFDSSDCFVGLIPVKGGLQQPKAIDQVTPQDEDME